MDMTLATRNGLNKDVQATISEISPNDRIQGDVASHPVANISSVPNLSPVRYPGGKTWFVPLARAWVKSRLLSSAAPMEFLEPFAGGGIVSLSMVFEGLASRATLVERDEKVGSVWATILG